MGRGGREDGVAQHTQPARDGDTRGSKSKACRSARHAAGRNKLIPKGKPIHWIGGRKTVACFGGCSSSEFDALKQG